MKRLTFLCFILPFVFAASSCNNNSESTTTTSTDEKKDSMNITQDQVGYPDDSASLTGFVSYNANVEGKRPVVLVVHEWWGLTDYPKKRAMQLAEMGYLAMAVDIYGDGKKAEDVAQASALSSTFYSNPQLANSRIEAALAKIKTYPQADTTKIAAIGYCFGGGILLNYAKLGGNMNGIVSFHGSLAGVQPKKELLKSKILVCHGGADPFVPENDVNAFKKSMDSINADYTFKVYPGASHAFTNPEATAMGQKFKIPIAYNAAADSASWKDMKEFFSKIFQ